MPLPRPDGRRSMIAAVFAQAFGLSGVMMFAWWFQRRRGNAGWVDVIWTFGTGAAAVLAALWPLQDATIFPLRLAIVVTLAGLWSIRLGLHLRHRVLTRPEDARYAGFRVEWGARFQTRLFWFLQIQAVCAWPLAVAVLLAARNPAPGPRLTDFAALIVSAVAILGEAIADRQLARFVAASGHARRVFDSGLWAWSRHPNYFFEFLGWCAWPLFAFNPDWPLGLLALIAPALMYWLLVHVSGIPPLEKLMLMSRGDAWRDYQSRTSAFFPLPPRREINA
jgi:steroid 5-alpha reductase family enzyme